MAIDLVGERFERLTVVRRHGTVGEGASWYCVCDCGTVMVTRSQSLRKGGTRSCGCLMRENNGARLRKMYLRHGKSGTSIHNVWLTMRARCENPRSEKYPYYGARGIKVCERWQTRLRTSLLIWASVHRRSTRLIARTTMAIMSRAIVAGQPLWSRHAINAAAGQR